MAKFCSECGKALESDANFCIACGASLTGKPSAKAAWQSKRQRVVGGSSGLVVSHKKTALLTLVAAALVTWLFLNLPGSGNQVIKESPAVTDPVAYSPTGEWMNEVTATIELGFIVLPMDLVKEKRFVRFNYGDQESGLPMLAYITNEGKVVTAVSMCEPCNSTSFHIKGNQLVCNACGTTWDVNDLEAISGSCGRYPPDAVPNTVVGGQIRINEQLVAGWQRRI